MENAVLIAVLFAAFCHATWNALIKVGLDPLSSAMLMSLGGFAIALVTIPFVVAPATDSLPWLATSAVLHLVYFGSLVEAYRTGDLGQVYPIARGVAPLMTATVTTVFIGETLNFVGWAGIVAVVTGVLLLSARGGRKFTQFESRAIGFALLTALAICSYSVVDGTGARLSGSPAGYALWLFAGIAIVLVPYALVRLGWGALGTVKPFWRRGLAGGALQMTSYGIALWAMTHAPIAIVAALRETSVLFGAGIAVVALKEPLRAVRIVAALVIVSGLVLIRIQ